MRYLLSFAIAASCACTVLYAEDPPIGWKEYAPKDKSFGVFVPDRGGKQSERERTSVVSGQRFKVSVVVVEMPNGLTYKAEALSLPLALTHKLKRGELQSLMKEVLTDDVKGKMLQESDVRLGAVPGREYTIETGQGLAKARVFFFGSKVYLVEVMGKKADVESENATTFLNSFRSRAGMVAPPVEPGGGTPGAGGGGDMAKAPDGKIMGGGGDTVFKDDAPEGGLLVGMEIGLGKFFNNDVIRSGRAIYRVDGKDSFGTQRGSDTSNVITVRAKPGYAVGAVTIKAGLTADGMSFTFMKIVDGKLDPKDSYESEWVGGKGGGAPTKLGGDGALVVGIIGKTNAKDLTGLGLSTKPLGKTKPTVKQID